MFTPNTALAEPTDEAVKMQGPPHHLRRVHQPWGSGWKTGLLFMPEYVIPKTRYRKTKYHRFHVISDIYNAGSMFLLVMLS